mmetsp:Transcript_11658/g.18293  ORF Transcript_11658/g.18293 Transcript_11658/m.18293 type:complete len:97 (-) Transcript_11658:180-470(-)|eukprot:CAMPEP_0184325492 /NCGR_PEP_ID=MMETSP1049-20130417/140636_1 /TAXON_ID=77928 /ORGANISM="Proteomonas sulcata, Strain CCMP704" /LENGTH=96 /DNA_ID=CAMNT_0026647563 /DNA_START=174 /DNA_END=464 /DNA_ORIENTATION=+
MGGQGSKITMREGTEEHHQHNDQFARASSADSAASRNSDVRRSSSLHSSRRSLMREAGLGMLKDKEVHMLHAEPHAANQQQHEATSARRLSHVTVH